VTDSWTATFGALLRQYRLQAGLSQETLAERAEQRFPVSPLALPSTGQSMEDTVSSMAVRLFVARARAVRPEFQLDEDNAWAVAEICRRVDGLPLTVELAAARVGMLPPPALLQHLTHRLTALAVGARDLPDRQRTLRTAIDWSYDLLPAMVRALCDEALPVFRALGDRLRAQRPRAGGLSGGQRGGRYGAPPRASLCSANCNPPAVWPRRSRRAGTRSPPRAMPLAHGRRWPNRCVWRGPRVRAGS